MGHNNTNGGSRSSPRASQLRFQSAPPGGQTTANLKIFHIPLEAIIQGKGYGDQTSKKVRRGINPDRSLQDGPSKEKLSVPENAEEYKDMLKRYINHVITKDPEVILITEGNILINGYSNVDLKNKGYVEVSVPGYEYFPFLGKLHVHNMHVLVKKTLNDSIRISKPFVGGEFRFSSNGSYNSINKKKRIAYRAIIQTLCVLLGENFKAKYADVLQTHYTKLQDATENLGSYFMLNFHTRNIVFTHVPNQTDNGPSVKAKLQAIVKNMPKGTEHLFEAIIGDLNWGKDGVTRHDLGSGIIVSNITDSVEEQNMQLSNHAGCVAQNSLDIKGTYPQWNGMMLSDHKAGFYNLAVTSRSNYSKSVEDWIEELIDINFSASANKSYQSSAATHKEFSESVSKLLEAYQTTKNMKAPNPQKIANISVDNTEAIKLLGIPGSEIKQEYIKHVIACLNRRQGQRNSLVLAVRHSIQVSDAANGVGASASGALSGASSHASKRIKT